LTSPSSIEQLASPDTAKLPLWRLIAGIAVLGAMVMVLLALAPVYLEDYQLRQYVHSVARSPGAATITDDTLRTNILNRAHQLDLPVRPSDIAISHDQGGKLHLKIKYAVQMDFSLYQVDLHPPGASIP
jgi:hypothetical protein